MKLAVVIPATAGREANLARVIASLRAQTMAEELAHIIVVDDGSALELDAADGVEVLHQAKHHPGMEQPRNIGVRWARWHYKATHVWFLDSDVVVAPDALKHILIAIEADPDRILICPYEWLGDGMNPEQDFDYYGRVHNDPRTQMFMASPPSRVYRDDLSAGLACFSGNLVWPAEEFARVGGFWSEIHHGRCEDGELGLRAVAMQVPISLVAGARGFHIYHDRNDELAIDRNRRDVPMLNARHPWVEGADVFMSDRDGAAFDVRCKCGEVVPTIGWWAHAADCPATGMELTV